MSVIGAVLKTVLVLVKTHVLAYVQANVMDVEIVAQWVVQVVALVHVRL